MTRSNTTRGLRPLLVAGLVAGPMTSLADAGLTFTLDPGQNIQAAINGAADGDEIVLNPGTYEQLFTIDRSLTIRSIDPSDPGTVAATVIDGVLLDSVVQIVGAAASGSSLEGLTITGGDAAAGDLRLSEGSPAIDAGDTGLYCGPLVDHDGNTRGVDAPSVDTGLALTGPVVDMGAYEFQIGVVASGCASDINDDASVGFADLTKLLADWGACP